MMVGDPIPGYYVGVGFEGYPNHRGADFPAPQGTPILAAHDGRVRMAGWLGGAYEPGGNLVYLTAHDNSYETSYQHMVSAPLVSVGQNVSKGQVIGYVGSTGYSLGPHLHFELWLGGPAWSSGSRAVDPIPYIEVEEPLKPHERRTGPDGANRRAEPSSQSALLPNPLGGGKVGEFNGWIYGETVEGNNVWFRGTSGNWFWSGAFTDTGTHDLEDLNKPAPPAPASNQRVVGSQGVNVRKEPKASGGLIRNMSSGTVVTPEGWVRGESITSGGVTSNIWYKLSDGYAWAEGFTLSDTSGLKDLNPVTPPTPEPPAPPKPEPVPGSHTPDVKTPSAADFPKWIRFETKLDPELSPTLNAELFEYYGVEYEPIESHIHWWGSPTAGYTHDGVVNTFIGKENYSVNFVVSDNRVTLMVPLNQNALTTGRRNPYGWKTENDPNLSEQGYKTLGFLHYLVEKLNPKLAGEPIRLHKEFMATACSELNPAKVRDYADKFKNGVLDIATGEPVVKPQPPTPGPSDDELLKAIKELTNTVNKQNSLLTEIYRVGA